MKKLDKLVVQNHQNYITFLCGWGEGGGVDKKTKFGKDRRRQWLPKLVYTARGASWQSNFNKLKPIAMVEQNFVVSSYIL